MGKVKDYPPLDLLKQATELCPKAWDLLSDIHSHNGQGGLPRWDNDCYVPIAAAKAVVESEADFKNESDVARVGATLAALAPWRLSKEVFVLDPEMEEVLFAQEDCLDIPSEVLSHLPYQCFYIQFNNLYFGDDKVIGTFVHMEYDIDTQDRELRFLCLNKNNMPYAFPIHLNQENLYDNLEYTRQEGYKYLYESGQYDKAQKFMLDMDLADTLVLFMSKMLQVVLYICASNADIEENPEQKTITHRSPSRIKDKYGEIRKWDVGVRVGASFRQYKRVQHKQSSMSTGTHASPRPHIRRGHWHNFWTGSMKEPSTRKLILKWISPIAVGVDDDESPVVVHKIDKDKDK